MRKLVIKRGKLELASTFPDRPLILIGRSPACDVVLRVSGVRPVHFAMEWVGEGDFNPNAGKWAVTVLNEGANSGRNEDEIAASAQASGILLNGSVTNFENLTWAWEEDKLSPAEIERGMIRRQVERSTASAKKASGEMCLEVIRLSAEGDTVVDVEYLDSDEVGYSRILRSERSIKVKWNENFPKVEWDKSGSRTNRVLQTNELLSLSGSRGNYYLRVVPLIEASVAPSEIFNDPFYKFAGGGALVATLFVASIALFSGPHQDKPVEQKTRIATVEIKEVKEEPPPPPPKPEPKPKEEPPPPSEKPSVAKPVKEKAKPHEHGRKSTASANAFKTQKGPVKSGLNAPAPPMNVNAVGLLGGARKAGKPAATVSADMIVNNGIVSESVSGATGNVVLKQPPAGIVDMDKAKADPTAGQGGDAALVAAGTTVSGGDTFDVKSNGPIGRKGGMSGFSIGLNEGDEATSKMGPGGTGDSDFGESVKGGLDREAVRRAVAAHRSEIRACYERALIAKPKLHGKVSLKWYITPGGSVSSASVDYSELHTPPLEGCVLGVIKKIQFPKAPNGQPTTVIYPFMFQNT